MSILMTLLALLRPISSGLIVGMCYCVFPAVEKSNQLHVESHCVQLGSLDFNTHCLLDIGRLTCFICAMHLILFPRQSTLLRFEQNSF
ncbi:unnamed protein product [Albugo candida]|uniref:Secreted protein n=1 Tax=Albugo candida TaxID=65357 RepID=A0A024G159_9STRA|nr:unnamed protein product [Albugo candida]|eukprot:CCI40296.1 unnamed protein product [Albugo candida]